MTPQPNQPKSNPVVIKKYANRRLYNTDTSSYVTLDDLCQMMKDGEELVVYDAKNGDDITRSVLTQIIVEQEAKGQSLLPTSFLRQLIGFYGNNMQSILPRYLDYSMQAFTKNQSQMRDYFRSTFGGVFSQTLDEMSKQNMAIFNQAMRMFTPFKPGSPDESAPAATSSSPAESRPAPPAAASPGPAPAPKAEAAPAPQPTAAPHLRPVETPAPAAEDDASIRQMQQRLDELQKQISNLSRAEG